MVADVLMTSCHVAEVEERAGHVSDDHQDSREDKG